MDSIKPNICDAGTSRQTNDRERVNLVSDHPIVHCEFEDGFRFRGLNHSYWSVDRVLTVSQVEELLDCCDSRQMFSIIKCTESPASSKW